MIDIVNPKKENVWQWRNWIYEFWGLTIFEKCNKLMKTSINKSWLLTVKKIFFSFYQQLTVRTCTTGDVMAMLQTNTSFITEVSKQNK